MIGIPSPEQAMDFGPENRQMTSDPPFIHAECEPSDVELAKLLRDSLTFANRYKAALIARGFSVMIEYDYSDDDSEKLRVASIGRTERTEL